MKLLINIEYSVQWEKYTLNNGKQECSFSLCKASESRFTWSGILVVRKEGMSAMNILNRVGERGFLRNACMNWESWEKGLV